MLISVIIPVYNVERYLSRCIDSVLNQSLSDLEIVLVDDGSTDSSGTICDLYKSKNKNIKVIHKRNRGPSDSRNIGIKNSLGEYIYFLDSDDWITNNCLEILYQNLHKYNAEISCGKFGFFDDYTPISVGELKNNIKVFKGEDACVDLLYGKNFFTSSCNILMKRRIVEKHLFPVGKYHEDELTTFKYFLDSSTVVLTDVKTYFYYQREGSIMHSVGQPVIDGLLSGDNYVDYCCLMGSKLYKAALCRKYQLYIMTIENYSNLKKESPDIYRKVKDYLQLNSLSILLDYRIPINTKIKAIKYLLLC